MHRLMSIPMVLAGLLGAGVALGVQVPVEEQLERQAKLDRARQEVHRAVDKLAHLMREDMQQVPERGLAEFFSPPSHAELGVLLSP